MKSYKLILLATAAALAALALPASAVDSDPVWNSVKGRPAPTIQVIRPADSTGTYRPATVSVLPVSDTKIVQVVNDEIARGNIQSGGGATALGAFYGIGQWTNTATFPLMVTTATVGGACYGYDVYWANGGQAQLKDDCEWSSASVSYMVPPGTTFKITGGPNNTTLVNTVTAMSTGATWAMTGVNGLMGYTPSTVLSSVTTSNGCGGFVTTTKYASYATYSISGPTGSPIITESVAGDPCGGGGGSEGSGGG